MMSEKDNNEDILNEENKRENYTINMKVNIKKNNNQPFIYQNMRGTRTFNNSEYGNQGNPSIDNQKKQDIMVISEEIYQKRISKV